MFNRKNFNFFIPAGVNEAIDNLEHAVKEDHLVDCYLEELRAVIHQWQDVPGGFSEDEGEEVLHYYYGRHYSY